MKRLKKRTVEEWVNDRGEFVRLEVVSIRSSLYPQWWQFKRRFRWWRLCQQVKSDRKKLDPETQAALAWAEEAIQREFLYGKE